MSDSTTDQTFIASADVAAFVKDTSGYYASRWAKALTKAGSLERVVGYSRSAP